MHYVIMEMADSYNDEVYHLEDSGKPIHVYTDKAEAEKVCADLQRKKFKGLEIGQYAYDVSDLFSGRFRLDRHVVDEEEVIAKLAFCNFAVDDFNEWVIPSTLTDAELDQVVAVFTGMNFYEVVPVK